MRETLRKCPATLPAPRGTALLPRFHRLYPPPTPDLGQCVPGLGRAGCAARAIARGWGLPHALRRRARRVHKASVMKTSYRALLGLAVSLLAAGSGCTESTDDVDTAEQDVGLSAVNTTPSATALASTHAEVTLKGERVMTELHYSEEQPAVRSNVEGVNDGTVLRRQVVDLVNPLIGETHVFGIYAAGGEKLAELSVDSPETVSFQFRRAGAYEVRCQDCVKFSPEALAAKDWESFVPVLNAGKAFVPADVRVAITVLDRVN